MAVALKLQSGTESPRGLLKTQTAAFFPRLSGSVGLRRGLRICISNTFLRGCCYCCCCYWTTRRLEFSSFTSSIQLCLTKSHLFHQSACPLFSTQAFFHQQGSGNSKPPSHHCWQMWGCSIIPFQRTFLLGPRSVVLSVCNGDLLPTWQSTQL